jgi:CheY-like chemotaxis protein
MLRKRGFSVIETNNGASALEMLRAQGDEIDVLLLDTTSPGMSSREVFEEVRKTLPNLKVILTSAHSRETVDAAFAGLEIERFIRKPFQMVELVDVLQGALSG